MIAASARRELEALLQDRVSFDVPMSRHCSLGVGGPADAMATPADGDEVARCITLCKRLALPVLPLGGGFNLLVRDGGLPGVAIHLGRLRALELGQDVLQAGAGVSHSQIVRTAVAQGLSGLEFAAGIPGSVGGWIAMNAGVPDREMKDAVIGVEIADADGDVMWHDAAAMKFGYRRCGTLAAYDVVVGARFATRSDEPEAIRGRIDRHLEHRRHTQPIDRPSCGSVFKNPPEDRAGRLIEAAGQKGARIGEAEISSLHANFIVTRRGARAGEVLALIEQTQEAVLAHSGILLAPEVRIAGRSE